MEPSGDGALLDIGTRGWCLSHHRRLGDRRRRGPPTLRRLLGLGFEGRVFQDANS